MKFPSCCGRSMTKRIETTFFIELACSRCGDAVFIKKSGSLPQMVDD